MALPDDGCFEEEEDYEGDWIIEPEDSDHEEWDPTNGLRNFKEPTTNVSLLIPVNKTCIGFNAELFADGVNPEQKIRMSCGCEACLGDILTEEHTLLLKYYTCQQPADDVLLTLFCGNCGKQITETFSAWKIMKWHGFANWIMLNSTKTFQ